MKLPVHDIESTAWDSSGASLHKVVRANTDLGSRECLIFFSVNDMADGRRIPMTAFKFNHRITLDRDHDGTWFNVQLECDGVEGAAGAFLCSEEGPETRLISDDLETFGSFSAAFMTTANWTINVRGVSGTLMSFPIPHDEAFEAEFNMLLANAKN